MHINDTLIVDTFAEAFTMKFTRIIVTADDRHWLDAAINEATGYGSSVIACDCEIAVEQFLDPAATPDGRIGAAILAFGFSRDAVAKAISNRVGQSVMTCPSTAAYDGFPESDEKVPLGKLLRFFGDGFQKSKRLGEHRYWRIPVMDGEFVVADVAGIGKGVAGGNFLIQSRDRAGGLAAAKNAAESIAKLPGVITPFPGGVVRSGSKVGSRYKKLKASTADAYCPTLRGRTETKLVDGCESVYEIVIDGIDFAHVATAMISGIKSASESENVIAISAGNYGGKLGKHHFQLHELLSDD